MNITDEQIEAVAARGCMYKTCEGCALCNVKKMELCVEAVATRCAELLREREANPGVWDGAPDNAVGCQVAYYAECKSPAKDSKAFDYSYFRTRTIPKDAKRLLSERIENAINNSTGNMIADIIECELRKE